MPDRFPPLAALARVRALPNLPWLELALSLALLILLHRR